MVKYVHGRLPVGSLVSKYAVQYPTGCPSGDCQYETIDHLLRCPAQQKQRDKLKVNLNRYLTHFPTDPYLKILVKRVVHNMLSLQDIDIPSYKPKYNSLIQRQHAIG